ncbi:MAG: hypothetical protein IMY85_10160, partial [Chloroflexi bacterium]|nr:hypothetical protein [Chloroflexota bacterium]
MTTKITSYIVKVFSLFIILAVLLLPLTVAFAQGSEGIVLVKDVFLAVQDVEDLPDEVTFALYDSETAATPIATQTFQKGEYAVDYDFSKLDGFTFGSVARFEVNFTNTLNINDDSDTSVKIYEIWTEMEIDGTVAGNREPVSNETLVQLLLASDASISTYLTLVYEGDENPITSIYKDLPISSLGADGSEFSLGSYFSAVAAGTSGEEIIGPMQVAGSDGQIQYNNSDVQAGASQFYYDDTNHRVGIGTANPLAKLQVEGNFTLGTTPKVGLSRWTNGTDALCRYGANMP